MIKKMKTLRELSRELGIEMIGNGDVVVKGVMPTDEMAPGYITPLLLPFQDSIFDEGDLFLVNEEVGQTRTALGQAALSQKGYLWAKQPKKAFLKLLQYFEDPTALTTTDPIDPNNYATHYPDARIAPSAIVEKGAVIGRDVVVGPGVYIGTNSVVGDGTLIQSNAVILHETQIGRECFIGSGSVIGGEGFGYEVGESGIVKIPQIGHVVLEDYVHVGYNTTVDRATIGTTRVGSHTKIDNLVQIGHNVKIGSFCFICSQAGIAGTSRIGNRVTIAGQVGIADHRVIGDNVMIGAQAGVMNDIPSGKKVVGSPAQDVLKFMEMVALLRKLPAFMKKHKKD